MLAEKKARPQSVLAAIPPYSGHVPGSAAQNSGSVSSPQHPHRSSGGHQHHHHPSSGDPHPSHHPHQHHSQQPPLPPPSHSGHQAPIHPMQHIPPVPSSAHGQHPKAHSSSQSRRSSADRGSRDSAKAKSSSTPKTLQEHVGPYLLGKTLGKGSSGCVKLARHRKSNEQVAVKIISKASLANKAAVNRGIEREIAIMKLINHPHVIRLYDVYETEKELFLVMEYVSGGELFEYLVNKGRLDEAEALRFFQQIIVGLAFCHKRKICHRDLKPENLLLDQDMNVKIADFGMASLQKTGRLLETSCGSPHYASPEVVTGMKYDGSSSDIWSCGIILYALLTGHLPFDDENIRQLLSKVKAGKFYMPTDISAGARDLISRMLTVNPKRRITMQGVMMHPWFRMVNPDRNTLGEPAQDPESARPMLAEELDAEIIRHMRWLFAPGPSHSDPEAREVFDEEALLLEIQEKMTNSDENMEKLFYHLLCQHKTELLENYSGDDNEPVLDGPRRRADSFPNSAACSIRSPTPDFARTPRSPLESPLTSPGSPYASHTRGGVIPDPTPFVLNPAQPIFTVHEKATSSSSSAPSSRRPSHEYQSQSRRQSEDFAASRPRESHRVVRGPPTSGQTSSSSAQTSATSSRRGSEESEASRISFERELPEVKTVGNSRMMKEDSGRGVDVVKDDSKIPFSPKLTPVSGSIHESLMSHNFQNHPSTCTTTASGQMMTVASLTPISPTAPLSELLPSSSPAKDDETPKKALDPTETTSNSPPSIESQVMSTQISEISYSSSSSRSAAQIPGPGARTVGADTSAFISSSEKLRSVSSTTSSSSRAQRPILHPLDVKASAGTTAMNVSASQHTRKYSEGTTSLNSTAPLSPTAPKRPWFARLFDFKPQPLTFRSQLSAAETQERIEGILRELFQTNIQMDSFKRPAYGVKCRFEGGIIDDQPAKAVKFKIDISEKSGSIHSSASSVSHSSHTVSSSAVAAILATVELHQNHHQQAALGGSTGTATSTVSSVGGPSALIMAHEGVSARRASDGGSILSSAAATLSTSLAAARLPFQNNHHSSSSNAQSVYPPLPHTLLPRRVVKVTLHQQQGANSTLRMIHERLCAAWDQQQQQSGSNLTAIPPLTSPPTTLTKAPRTAAI